MPGQGGGAACTFRAYHIAPLILAGQQPFGIGIVGMDVSGGANQLALVRAVLIFLLANACKFRIKILSLQRYFKNKIMEDNKKVIFDHPIGTFKNSVRAYREYKKEWRAKMEIKLAKMEEEIKKAKNDPFYKVETV